MFQAAGESSVSLWDGEKEQRWGQAGATDQRFPQPHRGLKDTQSELQPLAFHWQLFREAQG